MASGRESDGDRSNPLRSGRRKLRVGRRDHRRPYRDKCHMARREIRGIGQRPCPRDDLVSRLRRVHQRPWRTTGLCGSLRLEHHLARVAARERRDEDLSGGYRGRRLDLSFAGIPVPGHADPIGVAGSAAPDRIRVSWDRDTGKREIESTPAVASGKVFVTTMSWTLALDAANGHVLWNTTKAKGFSSPAVFNNSIYVGTSSGAIVRLNATDGALLWETRLLARTSFSGITSSPKVAYDRV